MLTGCGYNINSHIGPLLDPVYLDGKLETTKIDLGSDGRCPSGSLTVHPISNETRTEKYVIYSVAGSRHYFIPQKFIDKAVIYMKAKMAQSDLTVDEQNGEKILVSLEEAASNGAWALETNIKLKIELPAINYSQVYSGVEGSGMHHHASAYALHLAIIKFLNDQVFKNHLQCR